MPARRVLHSLALLATIGLAGVQLGGHARAAEPIRPGDAARLTEARQHLEAALTALAGEQPDALRTDALLTTREAAEAALARIEALADSYHHAANLKAADARAHALAMRPVVGRLFTPDGPLVLIDDVMHPRATVAAALAGAARRTGDRGAEIRWLRAALATAPRDRPLLTALRDACLVVGDLKGSNAAAARLAALAGGTGISAP